MTTIRRILITIAPIGLTALLSVGSASATPIFQFTQAFGNIPTITSPGSSTTSASQFNQAAVDAAIAAGCGVGFTCTPSTLYEIDFILTATVQSTVGVRNTTGSTQFVGAIPGQTGSFAGGATSGVAVASIATLALIDPLTNELVDAIPTFSIATNTQRRINCGSGVANSGNFSNCLSVGTGTTTFSGTGTDTKTGSLFSGDLDAPTLAVYVGAGSVTYGLDLTGGTNNGNLPSGVTVPQNIASVLAGTNGLEVDYLYTYDRTSNSITPEPTTMVLLGGALLGLGLFGKKRSKKA